MRRDVEYLRDILQAGEAVQRFLAGVARPVFLRDELRQGAVAHQLTVVGEAAAKLSDDLRARARRWTGPGSLPSGTWWCHAYFAIDWGVVWKVASRDLPVLRRRVEELLRELSGD